ncbi:MAG: family 78 glycoside hydrolase catalytic domain [Saprospiraceae bacterium]|nr:family 78 glycoside hydrolase catalytic domain [Saprospiraceae bacterium]
MVFLLFFGYTRSLAQKKTSGDNPKPNIIFILTDDQRWDALGYAGNTIIQTPEMDKLASEGVYFKNAIVTTPICAASRASILTGLYERTHKYTFQTGAIRNEYMQESYPIHLRNGGYFTGFYGKLGVNYPDKEKLFDVIDDYDRNNSFSDYRGYNYKVLNGDTVHLTRYTGQQALSFIDNAPAGKPFCLSLSFSAPHAHDGAPEQYFWQEEQNELYGDMNMPGPLLAEDQYFNELPLPVRQGFNRLRWTWRYDTPEKYQHSVKGYYRMIKGIDNEIGKIREKLKQNGLDKNTIIVLMGDNGYFLGERQLAGKWLMYDNSIRVPLIIYDPRQNKHEDIDEMALNIDIPSTMLDFAGMEAPAGWHGKSLRSIVNGRKNALPRDTILVDHWWQFENIPPSEGVRTAEWKYLRYINDQTAEELYNLSDDPYETNNLATNESYRAILLDLQNACDQLGNKFADPLSGIPSGLMVEYIREPHRVRISDCSPEFSWIVPEEAVLQSAYQILVASSKDLLAKNVGDVWNSGQVRSNKSTNVSLEGIILEPHTSYYWKVRIWDKDNRLSVYSKAQYFNTGVFTGDISSANCFQIEYISPSQFIKNSDGSIFIDFGKDAFGTLAFDFKGIKQGPLKIRLGEKLLDGKIDRNPGGTIRYQEVSLELKPGQTKYTLSLPPDERNTKSAAVELPDSFDVIYPFRYCEIENAENLTPQEIKQKAYFHYFDYSQSVFSCSDTLLNQIWDICKYSMKATSATGYYIDGDRERIPYEADAYINQLGHYCTDREYAMGKQTIEWFMQHPTWPTEWLLHTSLMMYQDYYYSGDLELVKAYYDRLKSKTLLDLAREDGLISVENGLVNGDFMQKLGFTDTTLRLRDIVDWPPAQKDTGWKLATAEGERDGHEMLPINTVVNSFFYLNMKIMAEFAGLLDKSGDQDYFEFMATMVKKAINEKLFDAQKGIYLDGEGATHSSIHANMLPLAFGIVPPQYVSSVAAFIKSRGMACSVYAAQYLLEALYNAGEAQYALDLMRATHDRSWWNMIKVGSTITMEAWDMKYKPNSDWNHAWGAAPANIIPRYLWGIKPGKAGFEVAAIRPQMGDLRESSITMPTLRGQIKGHYQLINNRLTRYSIELPANMVGEFSPDFDSQAVVTVNGEVVNLSFGSIRLNPGINEIEIRINSF